MTYPSLAVALQNTMLLMLQPRRGDERQFVSESSQSDSDEALWLKLDIEGDLLKLLLNHYREASPNIHTCPLGAKLLGTVASWPWLCITRPVIAVGLDKAARI